MISQFKGEYSWLSNFATASIQSGDFLFPSVEHAYMSEKSDSKEWKLFCTNDANSPGAVKKASYHEKLVDGWHEKKVGIMRQFLIQKFNQEPYKTLLIKTGSNYISEGNWWDDCFWGICLKLNSGENMLGRLIMEIRENLNKENKNETTDFTAFRYYENLKK